MYSTNVHMDMQNTQERKKANLKFILSGKLKCSSSILPTSTICSEHTNSNLLVFSSQVYYFNTFWDLIEPFFNF